MSEEQTKNPEDINEENPLVETADNESQLNPEQFLKNFSELISETN